MIHFKKLWVSFDSKAIQQLQSEWNEYLTTNDGE